MIQAIDLTKRYEDGLLALDHLNINILPGQIYCLLGANGAGKPRRSTCFFNFIEPTSGTALLNGKDCTKEPLLAKQFRGVCLGKRHAVWKLYGAPEPGLFY